ncbi:MAG: hypothetical protein KBA02_00100 [Paludibacteraceae bacterium]|nr:hypothetical protein [Paludibacteraceae bacterium]
MAVRGKCKGCEAKEENIKFLQKIIDDLIAPYKPSNLILTPTYISENGDIIEVGEEEDDIDDEEEIKN